MRFLTGFPACRKRRTLTPRLTLERPSACTRINTLEQGAHARAEVKQTLRTALCARAQNDARNALLLRLLYRRVEREYLRFVCACVRVCVCVFARAFARVMFAYGKKVPICAEERFNRERQPTGIACLYYCVTTVTTTILLPLLLYYYHSITNRALEACRT